MNTADFLNIACAIVPECDAVIFEDRRTTYLQLNERANRLANALAERGVTRGDRVAIFQVNCPEYMEAYFATAKIGAMFVPLNFRVKLAELEFQLGHAHPKVILVGQRYTPMVKEALSDLSLPVNCISLDGPHSEMDEYEKVLASASDEEVMAEVTDDDISILMFTAGTTGRPKAVPLKFNALSSYALENVEPADPDREESNLLVVPLYHVAGIQAMIAAVYGGRTLLMMRQFDVDLWLDMAQKYQASRAMLVPTMLKRVVDHPGFASFDLSHLKVISYGAAPMPFEVIKKAIALFPGVSFINAFGQTETASTIAMLGPEDHLLEGSEEERERKLHRLTSSIGKPLPDVEVAIADEEGNLLKSPLPGEIWVRGGRVMSGYWGDEEKTKQAITPEGWLRTGDMGWIDEDGYIFLAGRADDMIIRGGENISPQEVENALCSHPLIDEAAVIGVPHPDWGQEAMAVLVMKQGAEVGEEEIVQFLRGKLASYKVPAAFVVVDSMPHNSVGKLLKRELRKLYGD